MTRRPVPGRDERGVSLVLVLVTLVVFGLIVPVLGQFGSTNGVSGYVLRGQRFDRYAAEAGMQAAINWTRGQRQAGRQGTKCPDTTVGPLNGELGPNASRTVMVQCVGFDENGRPEGTPSMPKYALQTTDGAIAVGGSGRLRTVGAWWSEGSIDVASANGFDASADYVGANGDCSDFTASPKECRTGQSEATPPFAPALTPEQVVVDRVRPNPCPGGASVPVVRIASGLHWQHDYFAALGNGDCGPDVRILLEPGPHVFDFTQYGETENTWTITAPVTLTNHDGACDASAPVGFGENFALRVQGGATIDLCAPGGDAAQQVSMSTITSDVAQPGPVTQVTPPNRWASTVTGVESSPPTSAAPLQANECRANSTCASGDYLLGHLEGSRAEGRITMTIPDPVQLLGAKVARFHLQVSHTESDNNDIASQTISIAGLPGGFDAACSLARPDHALRPAGDWRLDDYTCNVTGVHEPYFPNPAGLTVTYEVKLKPGNRSDNSQRMAQVGLDTVSLSADAEPAAFRSTTGRETILAVAGGATVRTDGTVNLPGHPVSLDFAGEAGTKFGRGIVVGSIDVSGLPGQADFAPFALPRGGNYTDRLATFRAFLGDNPDPANDTPILTARVRFCDFHPENGTATAPCAGPDGGPAKILAWDPTR